jgi:hypothetical protein
MMIARINLDLSVTETELHKEARKIERRGIEPGKGTAHRHFVREAYRADRPAYIARICHLVSEAVEAGAEIVQLPAASLLIHGRECLLEDYARNFPTKSIVVGGLLNAARLGYKGDKREGSVVIINKTVSMSFPTNQSVMSACFGQLGKIPAVVAISSTVRDVRTHSRVWFKNDIGSNHYVLVLDLGHEQYKGRYKKTLVSVYNHLKDQLGMKPAVVLSQWRYANCSARDNWILGGKRVVCHRLNSKLNSTAHFQDEIDLITLT